MMTPNEKIVEEKYRKLQIEYSELKDKYDLLCGKLKRTANECRNEGDSFLSTYASGSRRLPWE